MFTLTALAKLNRTFPAVQLNGSGFVPRNEVSRALKLVGVECSQVKISCLLKEKGVEGNDIGVSSLFEIYNIIKTWEIESPITSEKLKDGHSSYMVTGSKQDGVVHTIEHAEEAAYSNKINSLLGNDPDLEHLLPIHPEGGDLFLKVGDGLILAKLINTFFPNAIDERKLHKGKTNAHFMLENLQLVIGTAEAVGCKLENIHCSDLHRGLPHITLALIWQLFRTGLVSSINLGDCPDIYHLLKEDETLGELRCLSPEELLIRWVNFHMERAGVERKVANFGTDFKDSVVYCHLLQAIAPEDAGVTLDPLQVGGNLERAEQMLEEAEKLGARDFLSARDVINGHVKLNMVFVANLFNKFPAFPTPVLIEEVDDSLRETEEERALRIWMNSVLADCKIHWIYGDLKSGVIILKLLDLVSPGIVNWGNVVKEFHPKRKTFESIENCTYAVFLAKSIGFSLVGIGGKNIFNEERKSVLAILWQVMRAHTLKSLGGLTEAQLLTWVREKLQSIITFRSLNDTVIRNGKVLLALLDAIKPDSINYECLASGSTKEEVLENLRYALTSARRIGAKFFTTPEAIYKGNAIMTLTVFAALKTCSEQMASTTTSPPTANGGTQV